MKTITIAIAILMAAWTASAQKNGLTCPHCSHFITATEVITLLKANKSAEAKPATVASNPQIINLENQKLKLTQDVQLLKAERKKMFELKRVKHRAGQDVSGEENAMSQMDAKIKQMSQAIAALDVKMMQINSQYLPTR